MTASLWDNFCLIQLNTANLLTQYTQLVLLVYTKLTTFVTCLHKAYNMCYFVTQYTQLVLLVSTIHVYVIQHVLLFNRIHKIVFIWHTTCIALIPHNTLCWMFLGPAIWINCFANFEYIYLQHCSLTNQYILTYYIDTNISWL